MFEALFSKGGLSLERLRSFLLFAKAGSISAAAPGDVVRQSLLSRQIAELGSFFGAELTERRGKTLGVTPAGKRLAALVYQQLQALDDFRREQQTEQKVMTLGTSHSVMEWLVMPRLDAMRSILGGATVQLRCKRSRDLVEGVQEGSYDLAILRADALPASAARIPLFSMTFQLCVPRQLLKRSTRAEQLDDPLLWQKLPFTAGQDGGQLDTAVRRAMAKAGLDFRPVVECQSMIQAQQIIAQGSCAGILPSLGAALLDEEDTLVRPFQPLRHYGKQLVLHYHARHTERRAIARSTLKELAALWKSGLPK